MTSLAKGGSGFRGNTSKAYVMNLEKGRYSFGGKLLIVSFWLVIGFGSNFGDISIVRRINVKCIKYIGKFQYGQP